MGSPDKTDPNAPSNPLVARLQSGAEYANDPQVNEIIQNYSTGKMGLSDALQAIRSEGGDANGNMLAMDRLYTDPMSGSKIATDEVMNSPINSGLFGQSGLEGKAEGQYDTASSNLGDDRNSLLGRDESYGLTDNDLKAYGQASGNIARMFGNSDQSLAQSLADRGMASAPNGVAASEFSGQFGNKLEQLAGLQQQIANNRINTAKDLATTRANMDLTQQQNAGNLATNIGNLGANEVNQQYGRQLSGAENNYNTMAGAAGLGMNNQALQQNVNNSQFANSFGGQFQRALTSGIGTGIGNMLGNLGGGGSGGSGGGKAGAATAAAGAGG